MLHLHSVVLDSFRVILCTCRITVATGELHNHRSVVSWFVSPTHNRNVQSGRHTEDDKVILSGIKHS
ncbi:hypothetical protein BVRB_7g165630 [Beta vulgaris subsp. vulgaris]|nr:hypothetical protein BVRB_7g165630 [Beta vulgaris subsp. vulgaris]